jgi:hypothetical protein
MRKKITRFDPWLSRYQDRKQSRDQRREKAGAGNGSARTHTSKLGSGQARNRNFKKRRCIMFLRSADSKMAFGASAIGDKPMPSVFGIRPLRIGPGFTQRMYLNEIYTDRETYLIRVHLSIIFQHDGKSVAKSPSSLSIATKVV